MSLDRLIAAALRPLSRRVDNMLARAWVTMVENGKMQRLQLGLGAGEAKEGVEHFEPYGFTSHPFPEAEALVVFPGGDRRHGVVVVVADRRYRLELQQGEAALYDDTGQKVHLARDGITVSSPIKVRIDAPDVQLHATTSYSWDVDGYGQRITSLGEGKYEIHSWQQGAVVASRTSPINPPEGPGTQKVTP